MKSTQIIFFFALSFFSFYQEARAELSCDDSFLTNTVHRIVETAHEGYNIALRRARADGNTSGPEYRCYHGMWEIWKKAEELRNEIDHTLDPERDQTLLSLYNEVKSLHQEVSGYANVVRGQHNQIGSDLDQLSKCFR